MGNPKPLLVVVVVAGGQVQEVMLENWPEDSLQVQSLLIDCGAHNYPDTDRLTIPYGQNKLVIGCVQLGTSLVSPESRDVLLPSRVLAAKQAKEEGGLPEPRRQLQNLRRQLLAYSAAMNEDERAPTGDDYNELLDLVEAGLDRIQASLAPLGE